MTKVSQWTKILGSSILVAIGFFFLFEAFASVEIWDLYQSAPGDRYNDKDLRLRIPAKGELPFLDHVPMLVILGIPLLMIGLVFYIKGIKEYLKD